METIGSVSALMQARQSNLPPFKLVSFSGIDGAGKSTQIEALCLRLRQAKQNVRVITFWDDVACLTRFREATGHALFRGDRGVGTPVAPIQRRDKNVRSWMMTVVRLGLYVLDAVSLRLVVGRALRSRADIVIFDRYIYDELANLNLRNPANRLYASLILKAAPKPHISYLLDADPAQARARKPEYPLEFLRANRASYLALSEWAGMTVIAPMQPEAVERAVLKHASTLLFAEALAPKERRIIGRDSKSRLAVKVEARETQNNAPKQQAER